MSLQKECCVPLLIEATIFRCVGESYAFAVTNVESSGVGRYISICDMYVYIYINWIHLGCTANVLLYQSCQCSDRDGHVHQGGSEQSPEELSGPLQKQYTNCLLLWGQVWHMERMVCQQIYQTDMVKLGDLMQLDGLNGKPTATGELWWEISQQRTGSEIKLSIYMAYREWRRSPFLDGSLTYLFGIEKALFQNLEPPKIQW